MVSNNCCDRCLHFASQWRPQRFRSCSALRTDSSDEGKSSDSDDLGEGDSDDDDSVGSDSVEIPAKMSSIQFHDVGDRDADSDDSDEPPEIPGSPMAHVGRTFANQDASSAGRTNRFGEVDTGDNGEKSWQRMQESRSSTPTDADILQIHRDSDSDGGGDGEEYVVNEAEQPRSAEFHASSSSDSDNDDDDRSHDMNASLEMENKLHTRQQKRPKTAAKDLECYRDVVPNEFFQQIGDAGEPLEVQQKKHTQEENTRLNAASSRPRSTNGSSETSSASDDRGQTQKYVVQVPQEVESLFQLVDAYSPEHIEIGSRLEPFVPDYIPAIGLPFDGIQIPRPDGKEDEIGTQVLKEPSEHSNVAELELLMQVHLKNQRKPLHKTAFVHSIDDAAHRPKEIDRWIESVVNIQSAKPLAKVVYKKPMPTLETLMELWPEEMEAVLATNDSAVVSITKLDMKLSELVKVVCVMLDIPVYEGNQIQSLHLLFSLYHEMEAYQRDMQQHSSIR